ncbi:MAG: hypothetical protein U0992_00070 [Planctomycetaceae bacterium]
MCGIVGYVGHREVTEFLVEGPHRLEYRGYDSAGVAVAQPNNGIAIRKRAGRVSELQRFEGEPATGNVGIGHTRWATHGPATDANAHPHIGGHGEVVLVHNGVIENYAQLRTQLQGLGYVFPQRDRTRKSSLISSPITSKNSSSSAAGSTITRPISRLSKPRSAS